MVCRELPGGGVCGCRGLVLPVLVAGRLSSVDRKLVVAPGAGCRETPCCDGCFLPRRAP
jgi:hypothetical protein